MRQRLGWIGVGAALAVLAEIVVFVLVAHLIGTLWALLLVLATGILGGWLLRREGVRAWRSLRQTSGAGGPVGDGATTGLVGLLAALLLVVPGFLTDLAGLALLLPPVRRVRRRRASAGSPSDDCPPAPSATSSARAASGCAPCHRRRAR